MSWKDDFVAKYGEGAYERRLARERQWREENQDKVRERGNQEQCRKGGKHYAKGLEYSRTGIPGERARIRVKHAARWRPYKCILAVDSVNHHQWVSGTSKYTGVALVEKHQHQQGIIDVIQIMEGEITIFTEAELRER
jgi:hypothetical protein